MLVDSHCHLDFPDFESELDDVVARARAAGVGAMVTIGTRPSQFNNVRAIAEAYDDVYCSVGVHPHNAAEEGGREPDTLVDLASHPKVVGIGESGLDYHYEHSPREIQKESFRGHIEACQETGLPLIVHTRSADEDTVAILREGCAGGPLRGVIHCFSTSRALADAALELGFYISLSGIVTFKNAEDIRATAREIPLDRILVETDAPYLAPVPKRGKRNEPSFLAHTAKFVAELKGVEPATLARMTTENFFRLFNRAIPPAGAAT